MKILVTGGSGMVGNNLKKHIPNAIYLSSTDCNLTDFKEVCCIWEKHRPNIVIHLAAKVGGIMDNIAHPAKYFEENILINTNVLMASKKFNTDRVVAILSTCIYPDVVDKYPMNENMLHFGPPTKTNFSYGYAKRSLAVHIDSYNQEYGTKYQYLIPCNLYGEYDKYGENSHFVAALIKKIAKAKKYNEKELLLFGTGTPLRQFLYAEDLAKIIKFCIYNNCYDNFNVATSEVYSIKEIAEIALKTCDAEHLKIKFDNTKPDGQFRKDVSIKKMNEIVPNFKTTLLSEGIKKSYDFFVKNVDF